MYLKGTNSFAVLLNSVEFNTLDGAELCSPSSGLDSLFDLSVCWLNGPLRECKLYIEVTVF